MKKTKHGFSTKNKTVGYGWSGRWNDGTLGWATSKFFSHNGPE